MKEVVLAVLLLVAVAVFVTGVGMIFWPAGVMSAGVGLAGWTWFVFGDA